MDGTTRRCLLRWSSVIGIIVGGIPSYLFILNPPTPWLIPVGPVAMAFSTHQMVKYLLGSVTKRRVTEKTKLFSGIVASIFYVACSLSIYGLILGSKFWAWAFVIYFWATIACIPVGAVLGMTYGKYIEKVANGKIVLKQDELFYKFSLLLVCVIFFIAPLAGWWFSRR